MKNTSIDITGNIYRLVDRWRALPVRKQQRYTLYLFIGYLLFALGIIFNLWYGAGRPNNDMTIEHIENPIQKKKEGPALVRDTLSINYPKKKFYEKEQR